MKIHCLSFALALSFARFASAAEWVSLASLGARPDGSADISETVNSATEKGPLFLPAGIYRVDRPLRLKNPLRGEGYSRIPVVDATRTWLVCAFEAAKEGSGVIEFDRRVSVNVENLNIMCKGRVDGIRIANCQQSTATYIDKVGIFGVSSCGLYVRGGGSRPVFAGDMTVFGATPEGNARSVGLSIGGACDCRFSNIEVMGTCIGMEVLNGHTYADNLHLWTGIMGKKSNPNWWKDSRGLVLGPGAHFAGANIYPDTSYHAIELRGRGALCEISNLMYWEDHSVSSDKARDGSFLSRDSPDSGNLVVHGGLIGVSGDDRRPGAMSRVYSPGVAMPGVMLKCMYAIRPENLDKLCAGGDLPDYTVSYRTNGFCKVADILTPAKSGSCEAKIVRDDGAAWRVGVVKAATGTRDVRAKAVNALGADDEVKLVAAGDHVKVYLKPAGNAAAPWTARFTTAHMNDRCRPVDHGSLRTHEGKVRYRERLAD